MLKLSIIIPTLDEVSGIAEHLKTLQPMRGRGAELIVVDGGSLDGTQLIARPLADRLLITKRGRARQMNAGAAQAKGDVLIFLHADTRLPEEADVRISQDLAASGRCWGRFDVTIEGRHPLLPVIAWFMNRRSRLTGIATGDQGMFARREAFSRAGGFPDIPLMEDIVLSRRLLDLGPPLCLRSRVVTSGRRWERGGVLRTVWLMWSLRLAFRLGADPARLAQLYGYGESDA